MSGERKNNPADMSITEQLRAIADDMCTNYCKWPDLWDEEKEGMELADSEHCANCPMSELV